MAGATIELERNVNLQLGTKGFGPFAVDDDVRRVRIQVDPAQWTNPSAELAVSVQIAVNGGAFRDWFGFTASGQSAKAREGPVVVEPIMPPGVNRQVQGSYTVSGSRFRTTITLEALVDGV